MACAAAAPANRRRAAARPRPQAPAPTPPPGCSGAAKSRVQCSGTGTTTSASAMSSAPARRIHAAEAPARQVQPVAMLEGEDQAAALVVVAHRRAGQAGSGGRLQARAAERAPGPGRKETAGRNRRSTVRRGRRDAAPAGRAQRAGRRLPSPPHLRQRGGSSTSSTSRRAGAAVATGLARASSMRGSIGAAGAALVNRRATPAAAACVPTHGRSVADPSRVFDPGRRAPPPARADDAGPFGAPTSWRNEAADRLADRLADITRSFPLVLDLGCGGGVLAMARALRGGAGTIVAADAGSPCAAACRAARSRRARGAALPPQARSISW